MQLPVDLALTHLWHRRRATLVSLSGVALGVAFFLAVSALMRGSEHDFIARLVDNSPHITVMDRYRSANVQPAQLRWPGAAVAIRNVKPQPEVRGIRGYRNRLEWIESLPGARAAPVLVGSAVLTFAGQQQGVSLSGVIPAKMKNVSAIERKMVSGSLDELAAVPNGIIIGAGLAAKFGLHIGSPVGMVSASAGGATMKVVGIFRTGNAGYDETETFTLLKRAQALLGRPDRVNRIVVQLADPHQARVTAAEIERSIGYQAVSWLEASEDILSLLVVRNVIMYSVVGAILVVAAFGMYNTIATMASEKTRDIAILKAMGFRQRDIRRIFLLQGLLIGLGGSATGLLLGHGMMLALANVQLKPPGVTESVFLPVWWGAEQYVVALAFAMVSSVCAAYLPASKAARLQPVDILRGAN